MAQTGRLYERIGRGYAAARPADRRIATQIDDALGSAEAVLNVGAGTGNYEPVERRTMAAEPSPTMLAQRTNGHPVVQAMAEALPFADRSFDATLALFTVHHWSDRRAGLAELGRVAPRQVTLVYDIEVTGRMWLLDYFPELATAPWETDAPTASTIGQVLTVEETRVLRVPPDCTDGFTGAYWNRPERYLDPAVQAGMSTLARLAPEALAAGTRRLRSAIDSGTWDRDHGALRHQPDFDMGYRLVLSQTPAG